MVGEGHRKKTDLWGSQKIKFTPLWGLGQAVVPEKIMMSILFTPPPPLCSQNNEWSLKHELPPLTSKS